MLGSRILPVWIVGGALLLVALEVVGVPVERALPFLLVLACPLLMLGMHGSHGGHDEGTGQHQPQPGPHAHAEHADLQAHTEHADLMTADEVDPTERERDR